MATNDRKHTILGSTETPSRAGLNAMLASVNDIVPVANTTERATAATAIAPTAARPLFVWRSDATPGRQLEVTSDGTTWSTYRTHVDGGWVNLAVSSPFTAVAPTGARHRVVNGICYFTIRVTRTTAWTGPVVAVTFPVGARPAYDHFFSAYKDGTVATGALAVITTGAGSITMSGSADDDVYVSGSFPVD